ncbi:type II 3-dehydroquinate dehydratase [Alkalicoccus chagannorensis]
MHILVINGPNLNLLGRREPNVYGSETLEDLEIMLQQEAEAHGVKVSFFQSNHEGGLIDCLHTFDGTAVIMNPGALTHYSYALRDAVAGIEAPVVEVHISNVHSREDFRTISVTAPVCIGQVSGFGFESYTAALHQLIRRFAP